MDDYDSYGRNITEQAKRQNKVPWIKAIYVRGKLVIPSYIKRIIPKQTIVLFK
jgi:hypothetical protein